MTRCLTFPLVCKEKQVQLSVPESSAIYFDLYRSVSDIQADVWESLTPEGNILFSVSYLQSLERSVDANTEFRYLVIKERESPIGVAIFQIIQFRGSNVESEAAAGNSFSALAKKYWNKFLTLAINKVSLNLIVCGNTFVTGEYGIHFKNDRHLNRRLTAAIEEGIEKIIAAEKPHRNISGILIKDFYKDNGHDLSWLTSKGFLEFEVNPNMILDLPPEWKTFEDYLGAMASKYRTRMRKALKRSENIKALKMNVVEMEKRLPEMNALYAEIIDESDFKLTKLDIGYLVELKRSLQDRFQIVGYYKDDKLVSFISFCIEDNDLVAGFMGMEREQNKEHDLYLNVLLTLIDEGIKAKVGKVIFGRTAMEIKSSVGAVPRQMVLYTKHRNPVINWIIHRVVKSLSKEPQWTLRSPFKEEVV